jgi:hypothetical protein
MKTILLTPEQAVEDWHFLGDMLKESTDHGQGESTVVDYLRKILNHQAHLWVFVDEKTETIKGVGVTQFLSYSTHKTLHIIACSGVDWNEWADQYYIVEKFAKDNGCKAVEQWGRAGWSRILPKVIPGFEVVYHVMRKEINKE